MATYFEDLASLGRWAEGARVVVDPGMDLHEFAQGGEYGGRFFENQPALRRVVGFIANQLGSVNLNLYSWDDKGDRKRDYPGDHPAARFLEYPADAKQHGVTSMDLKVALLIDALIHDKFCAQVLYDPRTGLPNGMRRLPASRVKFHGAAGAVSGATYHREDGAKVQLDLESLFFRVGFTPHTGAEGVPQIKTLRGLLDGDTSALEYRNTMLQNAAIIPGVLKHPGTMSDQAFTRLDSSWSAFKRGGSKAGSEPILEDGVTYEQLRPLTGDLVDDLEGRRLTDQEVATMYWIYPELIGLREGTNSNMQAMKDALWSICLAPYTTMWQQAWDLMVRKQFRVQNRYVDVDIRAKIAGSFREEAEVLSKAVGGPFMTRNEARRDRNLPSVPGGDELIVPLNVIEGGKASPMDGE